MARLLTGGTAATRGEPGRDAVDVTYRRGDRPRLPRHLVVQEQARLQLDQWVAITVVRGAQGYGKTTLVAAWLQAQPEPVCSIWVASPPAAGEWPSLREGLLQKLHQGGSASEPSQRVVLVLDDAHLLRDEAVLRDLVDLVARHQRLHLVVCSRGRHPIEALAAGVVDTLAVPPAKLLLTVAEVRELAEVMAVPLSREKAELLQLPLTRAEEYLRTAVLPAIGGSEEPLGHVTRLALAERLTHRLIRDFSGGHDPEALIRQVEATGLADIRYEHDDVVLELPPFIRACVRQWYGAQEPVQTRETHRRLSSWYSTREGPHHRLFALRHAVEGEDWEQVDRMWNEHATELALEEPQTLEAVFGAIPERVLTTRPGMQVAREMSRAAATLDAEGDRDGDSRESVIRTYTDASRRIASQGLARLPLGDLLYVGTGFMIALRVEGRFTAADNVADVIEQAVTDEIAAGRVPGDRMPWFHLQRGITDTLRANHAAALRRYQLTWQQRRHTTEDVAANAAANLALVHAMDGDGAAARDWLERYRVIDTGDSWGRHLVDVGARSAAALLALDRLDADAARADLEQLGIGSAPMELWSFAVYLHAQYALHFGDPSAAMALLESASRAHPRALAAGETAEVLLTRARADLLLAEGKGQHAQAALSPHDPANTPRLAVPLARLELLAGDPLEAGRITEHLLWRDTTDNRSRQELLILAALAALRMGDRATSARMMRGALGLHEHTRLLRPFATLEPADLESLLDNAGRAISEPDLAVVQAHRTPFRRDITLIQLTPRERVLARALVTGASRQQIADQLYVSVNTVRAQLATLYRKLEVNTREAALARLVERGLIESPPTPGTDDG